MPRHPDPDLLVRQFPALVQDLHRTHDGARCAEPALDGRLVDERLLDIGQLAVRSFQAFQRQDLLSVRPDCQVDAGIEAFPVDQDVAGSAFTHLAALLHAGQAKVVPQQARNVRWILNKVNY